MRIKVPNVANNRSTNGFVILSERSESKDLLPSPRSTVKSRERSFDCALRAPLRMTYGSDISASSVFRLLIRIVNCQRNKFLICGSVTGRGARRQLYLVPNVRNALAAGLARQIPIGHRSVTGRGAKRQLLSHPPAPPLHRSHWCRWGR